MLNFEPYSLETLKKYLPQIRQYPGPCADISAGFLFMWEEDAHVMFCVWHDTFVVREDIGDQPAFSWPCGADVDGMIDELIAYVHENNLPLRFFAVCDETLALIQSDKRFHSVCAEYEPRWSDYLYSFEDAASFRGRKFSGQRNHINKFRKLYGEPNVRPLEEADEPLLMKLLAEYEAEHADGDMLEQIEVKKTRELLERHNELGLYTAGLMVEDELTAFSIGEVTGDMLIIHVEKALRRFEGAYPTMYQGFVRLVWDKLGHPLRLVNREDDSGDPGLRISKQQYQPVAMANKYLAHIDSPAAALSEVPVLQAGSVVLTPLREADKPAYLALNTDVQNNRWWGYDYREDINLARPITEETFYESVQADMRAGDSINFAIRLSEDGEMIGEALLWNFTSNGEAEIGCRLFPAWQKKGYGRAAFGAAADFAQHTLHLSPRARCFPENTPSRHMIEANGFRKTREDQTHIWFQRP